MTPAVTAARRLRLVHELHRYQHEPEHGSYGLEAAQKMGVAADRVFKTLVVKLDSAELVVAVVPVSSQLSLKAVSALAGARKALMAPPQEVERATGYRLGGVSPLGQKRRLRTFIDSSANTFATVFVSAGRRGLEIELSPADLLRATAGESGQLQQG